jgi:hypothetical protein
VCFSLVFDPLASAWEPSVEAFASAEAWTAIADAEAENSKLPSVNLVSASLFSKKMTWL